MTFTEAFSPIAVAIFAEVAVIALAPLVAVIKHGTNLRRFKPFDCALCLSFWFGLLAFGPEPIAIAAAILARQIMYRLLLF